MVGSCVSHYRIVEKLGAGGMGEVFEAEDTHLRRRVAIKFPSDEQYDGERRGRFLAEARAASRLDHPNIARIYDYGEAPDGRPFLVMELVGGTTLRDALRKGPLPPARSIEIVERVLLALREAHAHGLAHRDIKPGNVMLSETGEVKVLDFGLAKELGSPVQSVAASDVATATFGYSIAGMVRGTPEYMSPEQARGAAIDERTDLFSAGAVLYECLTGRRAFSGPSNREVLDQVIHLEPERPSRLAHVPASLERVTVKALAKNPADRYQTADAMLQDLRSVERKLSPRRRLALTLLAGVTAVAVIAGVGVLTTARSYQPSADALQWYERGAMALRDGTYYRAAKSLEKAVELDPQYVVAHARLAEAKYELEDAEGAHEEILRAVPSLGARVTRGADALYVQAVQGRLSGDYPAAVAALTQLVSRVPETQRSAVLVDLGRARERSGDAAKAIEAYRQAIGMDRQNAAAHLRLAVLLARQQKPEASAEFAAADELYQSQGNTEGQVEVSLQRGVVASLSGRTLAEARPALERAIQMSRAISTEHQEIAATLQLGLVTVLEGNAALGEDIATETAARARRAGMGYLEARGLTDLGQTQTGKGDYARAEANLSEALATARRYRDKRAEARALFALGNMHQVQGSSAAAVREAEAALGYYERAGFRGEAMLCLTVMARGHRDLGHDAEALSAFQKILSLAGATDDRPQMARAENGIGSVLEQQGSLPEALAHYDQYAGYARSLGSRPMQARAMIARGMVLAEVGRLAEAEKVLAEAETLARDVVATQPLLLVITQQRAFVALVRGANSDAAALARRVVEDPAVTAPDRAFSGCVAGVALARAGSAKAGKLMCADAIAAAPQAQGGAHTIPVLMFLTEILLANGETAAAAEAIQPALDVFDTTNRIGEAGWRAWALAARVYRRLGDPGRASAADARASERLSALRAAWRPSDVNSYLSRPDLRALAAEVQK